MTNQRDEMSRFMMGVANLVREECRTVMLYDDMTLSRLIVYDQSIEVSKLKMMSRILKRSGSSHHGQPSFKKRAQTQEESRSANVNWRMDVVLKMEDLHVSLVERVIIASVERVPGDALVVVRKDTR